MPLSPTESKQSALKLKAPSLQPEERKPCATVKTASYSKIVCVVMVGKQYVKKSKKGPVRELNPGPLAP